MTTRTLWGWPLFHGRAMGIFDTLYCGAFAVIAAVAPGSIRERGARFARVLLARGARRLGPAEPPADRLGRRHRLAAAAAQSREARGRRRARARGARRRSAFDRLASARSCRAGRSPSAGCSRRSRRRVAARRRRRPALWRSARSAPIPTLGSARRRRACPWRWPRRRCSGWPRVVATWLPAARRGGALARRRSSC